LKLLQTFLWFLVELLLSRYSVGCRLEDWGIVISFLVGGRRFFSSLQRPHRIWDPFSLLSSGHQGIFLMGVKLTRLSNLLPRLEERKTWSHTSTHPYVFMTWCLIKQSKIFC
jgi:hypothetical protein